MNSTRRQFLRETCGLFFGASVFSLDRSFGAEVKRKSKPNIVYILADDMGIDSVSDLNDKCGISTPYLNRLIKQGMTFTDAHSGSAVCSPTRYGVLTGRYSWRTRMKAGIVGKWQPPLIAEDRLTVGKMLQGCGYHTSCIGKWHLGWHWLDARGEPTTQWKQIDFSQPVKGGPTEKGFDTYYGDDVPNWPPYVWIENDRLLGNPTDTMKADSANGVSAGPATPGWQFEKVLPTITQKCVDYISERSKTKQPFFLYFAMTSPHTPINPSPPFQGKSGVSKYADFIMETDWCVGQIMRALDQHELSENTLLIFTADNGTSPKCNFVELEQKKVHLREHWRGHKADIWEGGHRVPFIARWPGAIQAGSACREAITLVDFMATAAEIVGFSLPDNAAEDSVSLWPLLQGKTLVPSRRKAIVCHSCNGYFAVRNGKWKVEFCAGSGGWSSPVEKEAKKLELPAVQLYDLEADPKEQNNVYSKHPEVVEELRNLLKQYVTQGRSTPGRPQQNEGPKHWKQLPWNNSG